MKIAFLGNFGVDYSSETHHKKSLEALGHEVISIQEGRTNASQVLDVIKSNNCDLFVWVHTHGWETPASGGIDMVDVLDLLRARGIPSLTYHLDLWFGLQRQADLTSDSFYRHIEHFFTVDKQMADWFNANTNVKGHYLPAAVFHEEAHMAPKNGGVDSLRNRDVVFVGSRGYHPEWPYRPQLIDWLKDTYGPRFLHAGGDGQIGTTRGAMLNFLYSNSKVAVGDSLCIGFDYPYYWSDRVYETIGRGGFIIHPFIEGMGEHFEDGKHLKFYNFNDFAQLKGLIDYYLEHDKEREEIRRQGHEHVKANHTYLNRWQTILSEVAK